MTDSKRRLKIVGPRDELSGKFPRGFEASVRSCQTGDRTHRAVVLACGTLASEIVRRCQPPSLAALPLRAIGETVKWVKGQSDLAAVRQVRQSVFDALGDTIVGTTRTLGQNLESMAISVGDLDGHIERLVARYVGLAVHYSLATVTATCDTLTDPLQALEVARCFSAAMAYRNVGLGPCRDDTLHQAAREQSRWEHENLPTSTVHSAQSLELQLIHEYIGVHWKNNVDAHRLYAEQFLGWAFPE
jgi:hypothetical protein